MGIIDLSRKLLFQASNDAQKNAEQYSDESYDQFVRNTRLCTRRPIKDSQFVCVSIHRETKQLWKYDSKVVGSRGVFDVLDFEGRPRTITSYDQLLHCMSSDAKRCYSDLNESNWKSYFQFMLLPPDHSGETLKKQLLSSDADIVYHAVYAVFDLVLKPPSVRKAFLDEAFRSLAMIKSNLKDVELGGNVVSNNRFADKAIAIIEGNNTDDCFCRLLIDTYGPNAEGLARTYGFVLVQKDEDVNEYDTVGIIECPVCHKKYSIYEEYTGWHIPTRISCSEI